MTKDRIKHFLAILLEKNIPHYLLYDALEEAEKRPAKFYYPIAVEQVVAEISSRL